MVHKVEGTVTFVADTVRTGVEDVGTGVGIRIRIVAIVQVFAVDGVNSLHR
jgi:hypothetical protein